MKPWSACSTSLDLSIPSFLANTSRHEATSLAMETPNLRFLDFLDSFNHLSNICDSSIDE